MNEREGHQLKEMTLQEESRLSFYRKIAEISTHKNVVLVQHAETKKIYVRKELTVYDKNIYQDLQSTVSRFFPHIYECVESDGKLVLIEEYIQGQSLEEYFEEKGVLCEKEVRRLASEICEALRALHERPAPVIHRDLKPSNILLTPERQVKIIDFNIARSYDDGQDNDTVVMGTRKYAAPEQYGYAQTDARTDIYAVGVLMNYLLTGKYPSEDIYAGSLSPVIRKCIEFDPDRRYQTAAGLQRDLYAAGREQKSSTSNRDTCQEEQLQKDRGSCFAERNRNDYPGMSDKSNHIKKSIWRKRHPLLPPGFRTGIIWKMILSAFVYVQMWYFVLTTDFNDGNGVPLSGKLLLANRASFIGMGMLWILFWFNYLDIHRFLPLMKKKGRRIFGYILYTFLIMFVIVSVLTGVENAF
ncbi:MAG: serine/threonine protein kinase [Clostridiales bacterium]|nr:serine/threonine protein kinase [Clostridiales bacterium]